MAKLNAKDRKKAKSADAVGGDFEPMPAGKYTAALYEVETKVSKAGNTYWNVSFNEIRNAQGDKMPGRQWYMLMLPADEMPEDYKPSDRALSNADGDIEKAWENYQAMVAGRIKSFFEAFGYDLNSDTDEMIGERVALRVGVETIQQGARAGEKTNRVNAVMALSGDEADSEKDDDNDF